MLTLHSRRRTLGGVFTPPRRAQKNKIMKHENKKFVDYALEYAAFGWSVIPVGKNKKPLIEWKEYQNKRADDETIRKWWKEYPNANIGVVTGTISGIVVVDVEVGGTIEDLPPTVISKTGGGGWHCFYKHPKSLPWHQPAHG